MDTHPCFAAWLQNNPLDGSGKSALVVGCGLGDDAIELESLGFEVTAFDVSHTAIELCKQRFLLSQVNIMVANLLEEQADWVDRFDFVLEIFTVQALPPKYEREAIEKLSSFVAPSGQLLVVAEVAIGGGERSFENGPPWLLTPAHIDSFVSCGLKIDVQGVDVTQSGKNAETYTSVFRKRSVS